MEDISQAATASLLQIDKNNTLPGWFNLHRQLCTDWVRDNPKTRQYGLTSGPLMRTFPELRDWHTTLSIIDMALLLQMERILMPLRIFGSAKDKFKRMHGTCDDHVSSYLVEFKWQRGIRDHDVRFQKALELIRTYYLV
ncbi:hypothetical protein HELRODRAFT_173197 [Helobdella robusta]|uniref:Uncharacterized protein n=1 Tax=Helobdella robusta TaxID=6412 RepID=T1F6J5_HELRO|nr:hypothetical protein HELRODRAFT_173197 [Helobdella robusta]ESO04109.1 hypothetical protein HELRODRAFT_173197 [Helobdella robusta]